VPWSALCWQGQMDDAALAADFPDAALSL